MRLPTRFLPFLAVVALLGVAASPAAAREPILDPTAWQFQPSPRSPGAIPTDAVNRAAEILDALVDRRPTQYTGVQITGGNSLQVSLPRGTDTAARVEATRLELAGQKAATGVSVRFSEVKYSKADLTRIKDELNKILDSRKYGTQIIGVGGDSSLGVAVVYAATGSDAARQELKAQYGDTIIFRHMDMPTAADLDRDRDTAPHFGGAGYRSWNAAHTSFLAGNPTWCSTAFAINVAGTRRMLTAGHCLPGNGTFRNLWANAFTSPTPPANSYYFGGLYTTTIAGTEEAPVDANQDHYGDWAIMQGSTYHPAVYSCTNGTGSCSSLLVGAANWNFPMIRETVCTSGRTTGQICRHFVTDDELYLVIDYGPNDFATNNLAVIQHDGNLDGVYDCTTVQHGDSGGAVYQALRSRPGYVTAMGVITAFDADPAGGCHSYYTKLSGVRLFNASYTIPTL